jgi:hypothetical protein
MDDPQRTLIAFKHVHRGGHHNVYCNGIVHIRVYDGWHEKIDTLKCDCEKYAG